MKPGRELCQLAGAWDFETVPAGGCMAEQKIDGWRALYIRDWQGHAGLFTRNGQPIEGAGHILHRLSLMEMCAGEPMMFDGEFQVGGALDATKAWCESGWRKGGEAGTLHLFDAMPLADWRRGGSALPLYRRKARLVEMMTAADEHPLSWEWRPRSRGKEPDGPAVTIIADQWVQDPGEALALARGVWAAGGEGIVLKDAETPYERKRVRHWLKVKHPYYVPGKGIVEPVRAYGGSDGQN